MLIYIYDVVYCNGFTCKYHTQDADLYTNSYDISLEFSDTRTKEICLYQRMQNKSKNLVFGHW